MGELQVQEIEAIDDYDSSGIAWPWVAIAGACLLLVALLQIEGAALSCLILVASFLLSRYHPYSQETAALKASIVLSREDIEDTLRKYEDFLYKTIRNLLRIAHYTGQHWPMRTVPIPIFLRFIFWRALPDGLCLGSTIGSVETSASSSWSRCSNSPMCGR